MIRKVYSSLPLLLCLLFQLSSNAQQTHYWSDSGPTTLLENRDAIAVHFVAGALPAGLEQLAGQAGILQVDVHPHHGRALFHLDGSWSGSASEWLNRMSFPAGTVRSAAFGWQTEDGDPMWLTHEVVLQLQEGVSLSTYADLMQQHAAQYSRNRFETIVLDVQNPLDALELANAMMERGGVRFATPDFYAPVSTNIDPLYSLQYQMNNTGQVVDGYTSVVDIDVNAAEAWSISTGNTSMIVAVIDDGVEAHEDLQTPGGASRVLSGFTPATGGNGSPISSGAHGESCAGIIAASHNEIGVRGVAPGVQLLPVNIFAGGETTQDLADAFTYAKNSGASVISNSWGYPGSCTLSYSNLTNAINDAATNGRGGLGCVIVFASGNSYGTCVDYPAYLSNVIAVGAVTNLGVRSTYSNQGTALDVVAPSDAAPGQAGASVRTTDRMGSSGYVSGNYTPGFGGTSAACPVVAGVAALVLSVNPAATASSVYTLLTTTASDMGTAGFDNTYGFGRVNAFAALSGGSTPTASFSGQVLQSGSSTPISGVQVRFEGPGGSFSATTNASGNYSVSGLVEGGFYLIYLGKWGQLPQLDAALVTDGGSQTSFMNAGYGDNFDFNLGWAASGTASTGLWTRGDPIGTVFSSATCNPEDDSDDLGNQCYITGNAGGDAGTDDVDGGTAILTSPVFDLSGYSNAYVRYAAWFFNDGGSTTPDDNLSIRLSNGSTTVTVQTIGGGGIVGGGWQNGLIRVSDYITPTANMRLIAETADGTSGHLVEAGLDHFRAFDSSSVAPVCVSAPSGLSATISGSGALLSWNSLASEGAISYVVSGRKAGSGAFKSLPAVLEPSTTKLVPASKLRAGFSYEWKVQATCTGGVLSPESGLGLFTWPGLRLPQEQAFQVQPNPATDRATLWLQSDGQPATIRLVDLTGRVWQQFQVNEVSGALSLELDLRNMANGLYLVELQRQSGVETLRLVLDR